MKAKRVIFGKERDYLGDSAGIQGGEVDDDGRVVISGIFHGRARSPEMGRMGFGRERGSKRVLTARKRSGHDHFFDGRLCKCPRLGHFTLSLEGKINIHY